MVVVVPMNINVTMMRDFLKCPTLANNLHVKRRGPAKKSAALDVGTLFHEAMARRPEALASGPELPSWEAVGDEGREAWDKHKLWLPANAWTPPIGEETHGVEIALEYEMYGGHVIQGRLDRLVFWNGKYWSRQWKTYTGNENDLLSLQERVRLSYHEVVYQWLAEYHHYTPWGGTILGACNKLPGFRMPRSSEVGKGRIEIPDEEREQALTEHYLFRSKEKQMEMVEDAFRWFRQMTEVLDSHYKPVNKNYDSCFGPYGKGRCPFFGVCHEGASLDGPEFVTLEDRYAEQ